MLWQIVLKISIWRCFRVQNTKFECCQFPSIFVGVMSLLELRILEEHSFPHFTPTCCAILSWNFAYDFVYCTKDQVWQTSISINCCRSYASFNLELRILEIHTFFRTFLLYAVAYWAAILHMTLFYCTTDQGIVSSISVNFVGVMSLLELRILEINNYPHFSLTCVGIAS